MRAVLEEVDALPGTERGTSIHDGNRQMGLGESRPNVRRHVVGTFHCVTITRVVFRGDAFKEVAEIRDDVRVGVFLDREGG